MEHEEHFVGQVTQKAVLKYRESFIIVKEAEYDVWILPGGRLNTHETTEAGLLRELREELGVEGIIEKVISVEVNEHKDSTPKLFVYYLVSLDDTVVVSEGHEIVEVAYLSTKEDLERHNMHQNQKDVLEQFLH